MLVTVRTNDNLQTVYSFEPAAGRIQEARRFYVSAYMNLEIQGFKIEDETGKVVHFAGSW